MLTVKLIAWTASRKRKVAEVVLRIRIDDDEPSLAPNADRVANHAVSLASGKKACRLETATTICNRLSILAQSYRKV
jgi:hypothetical protein